MKNVLQAAVFARSFYGDYVQRLFHNADETAVSSSMLAYRTDRVFGDIEAGLAIRHSLAHIAQGLCQRQGLLRRRPQQVVDQPRRRFWPDAGQAGELVYEPADRRSHMDHDAHSYINPGMLRPPVRDPSRSAASP